MSAIYEDFPRDARVEVERAAQLQDAGKKGKVVGWSRDMQSVRVIIDGEIGPKPFDRSYVHRIDNAVEDLVLSAAQLDWLDRLDRGQDPWSFIHGRSAHGGASGTTFALRRKGLIDNAGHITQRGRDALKLNK